MVRQRNERMDQLGKSAVRSLEKSVGEQNDNQGKSIKFKSAHIKPKDCLGTDSGM